MVAYQYNGTAWSPIETTHQGGDSYIVNASTVSTIAIGIAADRNGSRSETESDQTANTQSAGATPESRTEPSDQGSGAQTDTANPDIDPSADDGATNPGPLSRIANVVQNIIRSIQNAIDSLIGAVSPVGTASASRPSPAVDNDFNKFSNVNLRAELTEEPVHQLNTSNTSVASATLRLDMDGLPDIYERSTSQTDPLDANSNSARTTRNDSKTPAIDGVEDYDTDSLQTNSEGLVATDPFANDTDGEGLPDLVEVVFESYSPTDADTNGDGISDAAADLDGDGLTTIEEVKNGTAPFTSDTDSDSLSDPQELKGPTNATQGDTDSDRLTDLEETTEFPTNPVDPDTDGDGTLDVNETFTTTFNSTKSNVRIKVTGEGDVASGISVENQTDAFNAEVVGPARAGPILRLTSEKNFSEANLQIGYNTSIVSNASNLSVFRYNTSLQTFIPVNSTVNTTTKTVSATVSSFSTYTVFNEQSWREYLTSQTDYEPIDRDAFEELPSAPGDFVSVQSVDPSAYPTVSAFVTVDTPAGRAGSLTADNFRIFENGTEQEIESVSFTEGTKTDIVFVFDDSGSMGNEIGSMKRNVRSFAQNVEDAGIDARYALVSFKDGNEVDKRFTSNVDIFKRSVNNLRASGGSDLPEDSLDAIHTGRTLNFREGAQKVIFHITDAASHNRGRTTHTVDELERTLRQSGTTFYTVSPSSRVKTVELANRVGGIFTDINSAAFDQILNDLQSRLTSRYKITYTSPRAADGTGRRVDVFATVDGTTANATGAYIAPNSDIPNRRGDPDGDGFTISQELGGFKTGSNGIIQTDPYDSDTDNDGIPDNEEIGKRYNTSDGALPPSLRRLAPDQTVYVLNSNPIQTDSDNDGITDPQELRGWEVKYAPKGNAAVARAEISTTEDTTIKTPEEVLRTESVTSDPLDSNSDLDSLSDKKEFTIRTDPSSRDTDGDSIDDGIEMNPQNAQDPTLFENTPPTVITRKVYIERIDDRQGLSQPFDDNDFKFHVRLQLRDLAGLKKVRIAQGGGEYTEQFFGDKKVGFFEATATYEGGNTLGNLIDQVNPIDFSTLSIDAIDDFKNFIGAIKDLAIGDSVFLRAVDINGNVAEGIRRGTGAIDVLVDLFVKFSSKLPGIGDSVASAVGAVVGFANGIRGLVQGVWTIITTSLGLLKTGGEAGFNLLTKLATDPIGTIAGAITDVISGATAAINAIADLATLAVDIFDVAAFLIDIFTTVGGLITAGVGGVVSALLQVGAQQFNNPFEPLPGASNILEYGVENLGAAAKTFTALATPVGLLSNANRNVSFAVGFYSGIVLFNIVVTILTSGGSLAATGTGSTIGGRVGSILTKIDNAVPSAATYLNRISTATDGYGAITALIQSVQQFGDKPVPAAALAAGHSQIPAAQDSRVRELVRNADDQVYRDLAIAGNNLGGELTVAPTVPYLAREGNAGLALLNTIGSDEMGPLITDETSLAFDSAVTRAHEDGTISDDEAKQILDTYDSLQSRSIPALGDYFQTVIGDTGITGAKFASEFKPVNDEAQEIATTARIQDIKQYIQQTDGEGTEFIKNLSRSRKSLFFDYSGPREHLVRARLANGVMSGAIGKERAVNTIIALESLSGDRLTNATKKISQAGSASRLRTVTNSIVTDTD